MSTTLTATYYDDTDTLVTQTLTFEVLDGYSVQRNTETVVHNIIGTTENAVTLRGSGLRTGSLSGIVGYLDEVAWDFDAMLASPSIITLADTDRPGIGMDFVVSGSHTLELDDDSRNVWRVTFDFEEVGG